MFAVDVALDDEVEFLDETELVLSLMSAGADDEAPAVPARVPPSLETMAPGILSAAMVMSADVHRLPAADRVVLLIAQQRLISHLTALAYESMAAIVDVMDGHGEEDLQWAEEAAAAEIGAALRLTRRAADAELTTALDLRRRLPRLWDAMAAGELDRRRVLTFLHATSHLTTAQARDVVDRIIDAAPNLTTGQLASRLRRLCTEAHPDDAERRYETAVADRRVVVEPTVSGTSNLLGLELPPHRLAAGLARINELAKGLKTAGETRTMDQLRADVLLDLLEGSGVASRGGRGSVHIHVDLETLAELNEAPGDLGGYGPVIGEIARDVARIQPDAEWRYTVTDPRTGEIVTTGLNRRRPTAQQRREVHARYRTCVWPGCRMPGVESDLDHRIRHTDGGPTAVSHLAPLCRHHHTIRHDHGWEYERLDNGDHRWTSPLGFTYVTSGRSP